MPERIQLRRTKGWRKPSGAVVVARPSRWGNPFPIGDPGKGGRTRQQAVDAYRHMAGSTFGESDLAELRGHDLACWCPLDQPCHADVLLELANQRRAGNRPPVASMRPTTTMGTSRVLDGGSGYSTA